MEQKYAEQWVVVYTAANLMESSIIMGLLRQAGIRAIARSRGHIYLQWSSPVDIVVPSDQAEQARWELIKAKEVGELGRGDNGHDER